MKIVSAQKLNLAGDAIISRTNFSYKLRFCSTVQWSSTRWRYRLCTSYRLINESHRVDINVSQRLGFWFYNSNSLLLFCSTLHEHFSTIKHLLALVLKKKFAKFLSFFAWEFKTFKSQCPIIFFKNSQNCIYCLNSANKLGHLKNFDNFKNVTC